MPQLSKRQGQQNPVGRQFPAWFRYAVADRWTGGLRKKIRVFLSRISTGSVGARNRELLFFGRFFRRKLKYPFIFFKEVVFPPGDLLKMGRIILQFVDSFLQLDILLFQRNILLLKIFEF
jgi:hypothetical protein